MKEKIYKIKEKYKSMNGAKRFGVVFLMGIIFLSVGVLSYYLLTYDKTVQYTIEGGVSEFTIIQELSNQILDVSAALSSTQNLTITNENGDLPMVYNLTLSTVELDAGNCNSVGDINFELTKDFVVIDNEGNFTMDAGINNFGFKVESTTDRACPQTINATINFS